MSTLREFAYHMRHKETGEKRIKKVRAENVNVAFYDKAGYGTPWEWIGTEPWENVAEDVVHISRGVYKYSDEFYKKNPWFK